MLSRHKLAAGGMMVPWHCCLSLACSCNSGDLSGWMTAPQFCGPPPTGGLSWQRGGGRCLLIVATQVGGWVDDGALASLSVPCSLVRQQWWWGGQRFLGIIWCPSLSSATMALVAGRTTVPAHWRENESAAGWTWCSLAGATARRWQSGGGCLPAGVTTSWRRIGRWCLDIVDHPLLAGMTTRWWRGG